MTPLKQGPTRHRPIAHPIVFRYLSYSTTLTEHGFHRLGRCPAFGQAVQLEVTDPLTGWPQDHGPSNIGPMVKS